MNALSKRNLLTVLAGAALGVLAASAYGVPPREGDYTPRPPPSSQPNVGAADSLRILSLSPASGDVVGMRQGSVMGPANSVEATVAYQLQSAERGVIKGGAAVWGVFSQDTPVTRGRGEARVRFTQMCGNTSLATPVREISFTLMGLDQRGQVFGHPVQQRQAVNFTFRCPSTNSDLEVSLAQINSGQAIVRNIGGAPAGGGHIRFSCRKVGYESSLSGSGCPASVFSDTRVNISYWTSGFPALDAGASYTVSLAPWRSAAWSSGTYNIQADLKTEEINRANDSAAALLTVPPGRGTPF